MIGRMYRLWPHPGAMVRFAAMEATLAVLQGLLLGGLIPILSVMLRAEPDLAAVTPWLVAEAIGFTAYVVVSVLVTPAGFVASNELGDQLRRLLMRHVTTLPLGWFDAERKADFVRTIGAAGGLATTVVVVGGPVINSMLVPATIVGITFVLDWRLALVFLAIAPIAFLLLRRARRTNQLVVADIEEATRDVVGRAIEFGQAQPVLRAAGRARSGMPQMGDALTDHRARYSRGLNRLLAPEMFYTGVVVLGSAVVLVLGARFLLSATLGIPETIALLVLAVRFLERLGALGGLVGGLAAVDVAVGRVERVLGFTPLPRSEDPARRLDRADIEFRDVTFAYDQAPVLSNVSLRCTPGTTTALVGPSGSGKTTVTRLVARFADVDAGQVLVGGVDVRDYDHGVLLDDIAIVFQDVYLFDTTIEENLRIANPDATRTDLEHVARAARLEEVIQRLPEGWDTRVGEAGAQLSGGERQRVSIARALLKPARIVLIDEAASALDPENESAVGAAIAELAQDPERAVLVIAHRPATLTAADQVIVLDEGRVAESGTPAELREAGGAFAQLYEQFEHAHSWRITA